ncbi:hypothetical protein B0H10DRAFT_1827035 [Mycena sp. CBHHK59/15]|nr:hypothetical protein B0H10DRAFT_1827035 [Mycena sp. CBHHK59/15]
MDLDFDDPPRSDGPADNSDLGGDHDRHVHSSSTDRGRSSGGTTTPATSRKRANQSSPPPPPPPKRQRQEPQFAEGYEAVAGAKPKAADYEPTVRALLLRAMLEYAMRILTINAFPDAGLQVTWAHECFKNACRAANERFKITERMSKLIAKRGSHIRSQIVTVIRVLYAKHYNFNRTSTSPAAIKANRDLSDRLNDGATFHYKDVDAGTGYAGNAIFSDIRSAVVFKNKTSIGAVFASHLNPYPIPTLALEFFGLDHCNSEWSTGRLVPAPFEEKHLLKKYTMHLNDIRNWADLNKTVVDNLRAKWYIRTLRGPAPDISTNISEARADALREELTGRTGLTDSETEEVDAEQ